MLCVNRKITYRLYPNQDQTVALETQHALHCRVYNTLLEEHQRRYEQKLPRYTKGRMEKDITQWRKSCSRLNDLNAQSLQVTAKRLHLAFKGFFDRVKAGETPGYPRFKSYRRYPGWGYKAHGDGWKLFEGNKKKSNHRLRLSGVGMLRIRGKGRFEGTPKTLEITKKNDKWYASITFDVSLKGLHQRRKRGDEAAAFDWGVSTLLTIAKENGTMEEVENPRFLKKSLDAITKLQRAISKEEMREAPSKRKLKRMYAQLASLHRKIANQRHDFYHKLGNLMVERFNLIGTEKLAVQEMAKRPEPKSDENGEFLPNGAKKQSKLNQSILDAAPAKLIQLLTYKAEEAGVWVGKAETKIVKPTQRCHICGTVVPKELHERVHRCPECKVSCGRDENAAKTLLRWLFEGYFWSGTGLQKPA